MTILYKRFSRLMGAITLIIGKLTTTARRHWLTTATLILAIVGGVPGIIAIYDHFVHGPNVAILVQRFDTGDLQWPANPEKYAYLLLEMEVFNQEERAIPLPPGPFELSAKVRGRWVPFKKATIPLSGTVLYKDGNDKTGSNIDHMDLQKFRELNVSRLYGHFNPSAPKLAKYLESKHYILFLTSEVTSQEIHDMLAKGLLKESVPVRLRWRDVQGGLHDSRLTTKGARVTVGCYKVYAKHVEFYRS